MSNLSSPVLDFGREKTDYTAGVLVGVCLPTTPPTHTYTPASVVCLEKFFSMLGGSRKPTPMRFSLQGQYLIINPQLGEIMAGSDF